VASGTRPGPRREFARLSPRRWHLWSLAPPVVAYFLVVEALAVVAGTATMGMVPVTSIHWLWFGLLLVGSTGYLEAVSSIERNREIAAGSVHLLSVWLFAAVLLLPPPLLCLLIVLGYLHRWARVYRFRAPVHRKLFSVATIVLGAVAAYGVLHTVYPGTTPFAAALSGPTGLLAVIAAGVVYRVINDGLVTVALMGIYPGRSLRAALSPAADQLMVGGAVGLGAGLAVVLIAQPWWTPLLIITVLALHTGLLMPQFRDASRSDAKTGLFNAAFWVKLMGHELARSRRLGGTVGVLVLDLDHFKRVNDSYGHLAGDVVLRAVADAIKHSVRGHDIVGRYGGEEFTVLLPGLDVDDVRRAAERMRAAVARLAVSAPDLEGNERVIGGLTASVGVAVFPDHAEDGTSLLLAADAALYDAKGAGRDRTRIAGEKRRQRA
jgi:diguanylate cyclase (GGDEF)-like protein